MKNGQPLTDADRKPWLAAVAAVIDRWRGCGERGVITCSALKTGLPATNHRRTPRRSAGLSRRLAGADRRAARRRAAAISCRPAFSTANSRRSSRQDPMKIRLRSVSIGPVDEIVERIVGVLLPSTGPPSSSCNREGQHDGAARLDRRSLRQHHSHPVHRCGSAGEIRPSRDADGDGAGRLHAVAGIPALRPGRSDLAEPRPLRAVHPATPRPCSIRCCT